MAYRIMICIDVEWTNADANRLESALLEQLAEVLDQEPYVQYVKNVDSCVDTIKDSEEGA